MSSILTDEEVRTIVLSLLYEERRKGGAGLQTEQLERVLKWAENVRIDAGLLENVLEHNALISIGADGKPEFRLSEKGTREAEQLVAQAREPQS